MGLTRGKRRYRTLAIVLVATLTGLFATPASPAYAYTTVVYNGAGSAPRISVIGDSTIAALRWTNTFEPLRRFNFVYDAESCRRTATASCRGREGYQPDNVISTMRRLSGRLGSLLVIMGGYDDPGFGFASAVDSVMAEASRQGIPAVMWLTLRTADVSYVGPTFRSNATTFRDNNRILLLKAAQYGSRLQIADWATYSANRPAWFYADGIHLRPAGALAAATYIADQSERVLGQINSGWPELRINASGRLVAEAQQALIDAGVLVRGGVTGRFDIYTYYAVSTFQRYNGLTVTGSIDAATARKLGLLGGEWRPLGRGSTGDAVRRAQQALLDRGIFVRGGVTGVFDIYTTYAVQTFQRFQGITATGLIDAETARRLGLHVAPNPADVWDGLALNDTGINVTRAQRALIDAGIFVRGGATGTFDIYTLYAVNTFQRRAGLTVTGRIDPDTAEALGLFDPTDPVRGWVELRLGSSGPFVERAQRALIARRIVVQGGATGVFNLGTFYAVSTFQRYNDLPVSGRVDLATADKLGLFDPMTTALVVPTPAVMTTTTTTTVPTSTSTTTTVPVTTTVPAPTTVDATSTTVAGPTSTPPIDEPVVLGGVVWLDADSNGRRDPAETGVADVEVRVLDLGAAVVGTTLTDRDGEYEFAVAPGRYLVEVVLPVDMTITAGLVGDDRSADSDAITVDPVLHTARTDWVAVVAGTPADGVDVGLVSEPEPVPTSTVPAEPTTSTSTTSTPLPTTTIAPVTLPPTTPPSSVPASTTLPSTSAPTSTDAPPSTATTPG